MDLTIDQLLGTFVRYNQAIWPLQILAYVLGGLAVYFVFRKNLHSSRIISGILVFMWLWTGIVFFMIFFTDMYAPAFFGGLFILQGLFFLLEIYKPRISFTYRGDIYAITGIILIFFALVGYPVLGYMLEHWYPQAPPFGLAPCPVGVFTFGLLLLSENKVPKSLLFIPFIWALGGIMPVSIGFYEDIILIAAGLLATGMIVYRDRKRYSSNLSHVHA